MSEDTDTPVEGEFRYSVVPDWITRHPGLSPVAVRVYAALGRYANAAGSAFPARATLADDIGTSVDTVDRAIKLLWDAGALEVRRRTTENGDPTSNLYILRYSPPGVAAPARLGSRGGAHIDSRTAAALTTPRGNDTPPTPQVPAERWARRWCEVVGVVPTRPVLRAWIPQVQEYIRVAGEPTEALLQMAAAQGINTPNGWGYTKTGPKPTKKSTPIDPATCQHVAQGGATDERGAYCPACKTWESERQ